MDSSLSKYKWSSGAAILGVLFVFILLIQIFPHYREWILGILMMSAFAFLLYRFLVTGERFILGGIALIIGLGIDFFFVKNSLLQALLALIIILLFLYFYRRREKIERKRTRPGRSYQILAWLMALTTGAVIVFFPLIKDLIGLPLAIVFLALWLVLGVFVTQKEFSPDKSKSN